MYWMQVKGDGELDPEAATLDGRQKGCVVVVGVVVWSFLTSLMKSWGPVT